MAAGLAAPARAIDASAGTGGASFMKIGTGNPRAQALGNAYVALAEGVDALTWNPAGIAVAQQRAIVYSNQSWLQGYGGHYIGYVQPTGRTVWGANLASLSVDGFEARDSQGIPVDNSNIVARDAFATVGLARSFFLERFFLGGAVRGIQEDDAGTKYQSVVGDLGVLFRPSPRFALGAAVQNVFGDKTNVAQTQRYGAAFTPSSFLTVSLEVSKESDNQARVGAGLEISLPQELLSVGEFSLRLGMFNQDNSGPGTDETLKHLGLDKTNGFSFGVGLYSPQILGYGVGLDYSLVPFGALGVANQIAVKLTF